MLNLKILIINILIPYISAFIGGMLGNSSGGFNTISKPKFTPPAIAFPIVWAILYTLMGISSYIIYTANSKNKKSALIFYGIQLIANSLWTLLFFNLKWYLFSFIWIIILIILVAIMIWKFYKINKLAGLLQVPYLLWLIFASILNFNIFLINK